MGLSCREENEWTAGETDAGLWRPAADCRTRPPRPASRYAARRNSHQPEFSILGWCFVGFCIFSFNRIGSVAQFDAGGCEPPPDSTSMQVRRPLFVRHAHQSFNVADILVVVVSNVRLRRWARKSCATPCPPAPPPHPPRHFFSHRLDDGTRTPEVDFKVVESLDVSWCRLRSLPVMRDADWRTAASSAAIVI